MPTRAKKIFIVSNPGSDQSLFYRLWKLTRGEQRAFDREQQSLRDDSRLAAVAAECERWSEQMRRQQVHIDEIKRLCHVPITP